MMKTSIVLTQSILVYICQSSENGCTLVCPSDFWEISTALGFEMLDLVKPKKKSV